jgi:arylformamidase
MPQIRRVIVKEAPVAAIDYEVEYNNRARVPEHPEIFARWAGEAEFYRADMLKNDRAELGLTYGSTPRQTVDLFLAEGHENAPLAIFIHGGWWRSLDPSTFSQMARGPNGRGISVAVVGYDLCPNVGIGDIVEQMRRMCAFLWQRFGRRMTVYGHSAGGHLAAALVATDWRTLYPKAPADLVPAAYSISGVFDLTPLLATSVNQDLRLDSAQARNLSPLFWPVPAGRIFDAVAGGLESNEFKRQSRAIAQAWQQAGARARYEEVVGTNHFTVIDPLSDPQSAMTARVADLAKTAGA